MGGSMNLKLLAKKFNPEDIEWRTQQCGQGNNGPWALIIPYITSRAIMQRLDDVVGPGNWKNEFIASPCNTGYQCGISIKIDNEWVTRWDGSEIAGAGNIDKVKSTMSAAMKRTGVQWGIGRYLYQFEATFADAKTCDNRYKVLDGYTYQEGKIKGSGSKFGFQWKAKPLPTWAMPVTDKEVSAYVVAMKKAPNFEELKMIFSKAYKMATAEGDDSMMDKFVKAKDAGKENLTTNEEQQKTSDYELLAKTVSEQINIINSAVNESAVNGLSNLAIEKVKHISNGDNLKQAMKEIKVATSNKINKLQGNK